MPYKLVAIGRFPLNPFSNSSCWIEDLVANAYPGQVSVTLEMFDDVVMVFGAADLRYTQKSNKLLFCHKLWARCKAAVTIW